jgi:hypothetical protein
MKQQFQEFKFQPATIATIEQAVEIIEEYQAQGFVLTLRQLYYQFVARDLVPNTERSYNRIGDIVNKGRLAGLIDWDAIEDRTRSVTNWVRRRSPRHAIELAREHYGIDMWQNQTYRVEVWIEKEALAGVIHEICGRYDVPYFSCRGYVSQSEQYAAGRRAASAWAFEDKEMKIIHLGDLDPSGVDMTRDNQDRLHLFGGQTVDVNRIALNESQIAQYGPPPNPAKQTDSRFAAYAERYGYESWELDALEPQVMVDLIEKTILEYRDDDAWQERVDQREADLATLDEIIENLADA